MTSGTALTVGAPALLNIAVGPNQSSLPLGETEQLTATGTFSNGANQNLTQSAKWSSSSSTIANVNAQGVVTGMGAGIAQLSAAYQGITGSTAVAVGQPALLSLTVGPNPFSLPLGETGQFTAIGRFSDGSTQNLTQSVTWGSSSPAIASVSPAGTAVANAVGAVTVSAASAAVTGSASLTVSPPVVVGLSIVPGNLSIVIEGSRPLQAMATMSDGTTQNMTAAVAWSSAEPDVASVNNGGMVIAEQVGSTTIVAQTSGFSAAAGVTVTPLMTVNYFNRASAVQTGVDGSLQLTNPGVTPGDLCAMVYVLDQTQVLSECCGCSISDGGLRSLSLLNDLTANPLTGKQPQVGVIMVVPSNPGQNGQCDAGASNPNGVVLGWQSNPVAVSGGTSQITETSSSLVALNSVEAAVLVSECSMVEQLGSGNGICSCGKGD
jgi:hypothetical protein